MAKRGTQRRNRYDGLRAKWFTPLEARELSVLPKSTPALRLLITEREERRARFEKIAASKVAKGKWRRQDVALKWKQNLVRMYTKRGWRVKGETKGRQPKMPKGSPNPWAPYRDAERRTGGPKGKDYVSPWQVRQLRQGKTKFQKGLIFIQKAEKDKKTKGGASHNQVRDWIAEKDEAIRGATGARRKQLIIERNRLEKLL